MKFHSQTKEEWTLTGLALSVHMDKILVAGVDLNSVPTLILCNLLILQYAKLAKTAKKADLSYNFPTLSMKPDSHQLPLKPRHDSSAPSNGFSVSRFSVACNARMNDYQCNPTFMGDSSGTPAASRQQPIDALSTPIDRLATIPGNEEVLEVIRQSC